MNRTKPHPLWKLKTLALLPVFLLSSTVNVLAFGEDLSDETCLMCHAGDPAKREVDPEAFAQSVHGGNSCISCHTEITSIPHHSPLPPVDCMQCHSGEAYLAAADFNTVHHYNGRDELPPLPAATAAPAPQRITNQDCLDCHGDPGFSSPIDPEKFAKSIHSKLLCTSCHIDVKEVFHDVPLQPVSCSQCHRIETEIYLESDHGIAMNAGMREAASCRDCHGDPHVLLDSRNPESPVSRGKISATCASCHVDLAAMDHSLQKHSDAVATYLGSLHGMALSEKEGIAAAVCTDCHGSHDLHKATNPASKLYWQNIPSTCGKCHENVQQTFARSVHGAAVIAGKRDAPVCTDCHGEHNLMGVKESASKVFPSHITETCAQCHAAERIVTRYRLASGVVDSYMDSFHGLSSQLGSTTAANCASCHGVHDILPSHDKRSSIHQDNLVKTCGKCHSGISAQVAQGRIHLKTTLPTHRPYAEWVRIIYTYLIVIVIGGMLLHNFLDFSKKMRKHYKAARVPGTQRMSRTMRMQHLLLILSFVALAYSGFALKFPHAWWASPFMGHPELRSMTHRIAALVFTLLSLGHLGFLCFTRRGRSEFKAMQPRRRDFVEPFQMMAFYLGLRKERPKFARYSYVEKAEYWALMWGSAIMIVTGGLMLWKSFTLQYLPKWAYDVFDAIHYYEAILACLAIVVWHFYFVIFDPDEYPMKFTWLSGEESPADRHHREAEGEADDDKPEKEV